jgi:F-type H+-transporting ATPase subunit b
MRHGLICLAMLLTFGLLLPSFAYAAKAEGGEAQSTEGAKDQKGGEGEKKADMGSMSGLKRWDLGIWTLVVFGILFVVLGKFAWGPMMKGLDAREAAMRKTHEDAEAARVETAKSLEEIKARLAKANDEVRAMLDEARRDAQSLKDKMKADAAGEIAAERERVRKEIDTARDAALQEIYQQAVQLAALVSTRAVKRELTPADHSRLIDEALVDLKSNLSARA